LTLTINGPRGEKTYRGIREKGKGLGDATSDLKDRKLRQVRPFAAGEEEKGGILEIGVKKKRLAMERDVSARGIVVQLGGIQRPIQIINWEEVGKQRQKPSSVQAQREEQRKKPSKNGRAKEDGGPGAFSAPARPSQRVRETKGLVPDVSGPYGAKGTAKAALNKSQRLPRGATRKSVRGSPGVLKGEGGDSATSLFVRGWVE